MWQQEQRVDKDLIIRIGIDVRHHWLTGIALTCPESRKEPELLLLDCLMPSPPGFTQIDIESCSAPRPIEGAPAIECGIVCVTTTAHERQRSSLHFLIAN